jgi:uncharacterized protein YjiS (DUF1127 family)
MQQNEESKKMERGSHYGADAQLAHGQMASEQARRLQAEVLASALPRAGRMVRRAATAVMGWLDGWLIRPLARQASRRHAIAQLSGLDARLLADIGLERGDIELAVDGHLDDDRVRHPRRSAPARVSSVRPVAADVVELKVAARHRVPASEAPSVELQRAS